MSANYISINSGELVPLETVKRISTITESERESLASLGPHVDPYKFNTRIETADGQKSYAPETVQDISRQGVGLVQLDEGSYVPSENVVKAKNLSATDRARFQKNTGREMAEKFISQVETKAGTVLATISAEKVLEQRGIAASRMSAPKNMAEVRDAVMEQVPKAPSAEPNAAPVVSAEIGREL